MQVHQIMTREVITVRPEMPALEAVRLMISHRVSGLPVINDNGRLVGIVSEGDFVRRAEIETQRPYIGWLDYLFGTEKAAADFVKENGRKVADVMTSGEVFTVGEEATLSEVAQLMRRENIKRIPVVRSEALVGIVTRMDLLRAFATVDRNPPELVSVDAAIRDQVISSIRTYEWQPSLLDVRVQDGVVEVSGNIVSDRYRRAVIVAAENVPGVLVVRDRLRVVEG